MQHRILTRELNTQATASDVYAELCISNNKPLPNTALFETAAVGQLHHVKSLLMLSAAVSIECINKQVHFKALSENGKHFLNDLKPLFDFPAEITSAIVNTDTGFYVDCNSNQTQKLLRSGDVAHDAVTFLFGYFAYDLVDQFEQVPDVKDAEKPIPDYVYYLADKLLIRDEQAKTAKLFTLAFDRNANNLTLNTELNALAKQLESLSPDTEQKLPEVDLNDKQIGSIESYATTSKQLRCPAMMLLRRTKY